jgi:hypothetical protein
VKKRKENNIRFIYSSFFDALLTMKSEKKRKKRKEKKDETNPDEGVEEWFA